MEIEVGEYVRTLEQGFIGKLIGINEGALNYYKIDVGREIIHCDNSRDNYIYSRDGFGLKHSKNIIDLIEKDDYVNGERMDIVERDENGKVYYLQNAELPCISIKDIKSIVTKEQFKNIEYRLE